MTSALAGAAAPSESAMQAATAIDFNLPTIQTSIESCFNSVLTISSKPRATLRYASTKEQRLCQSRIFAGIQRPSEIYD
jgi:hypothetical protein